MYPQGVKITDHDFVICYRACQVCTPNATNSVWSHCQCVLADGVERGILTVNRMLPGPSIQVGKIHWFSNGICDECYYFTFLCPQVCEGDKVVIDVRNSMEGMEATIHWHGIHQRGTQYSDGVPYVTQCPILNGNTFRYQWLAGNAGTHFWHAHTGMRFRDYLFVIYVDADLRK